MKKEIIAHPFLFATNPVLALFATNASMLSIDQIVIPIVTILISVTFLYSLLNFILKDKHKAGIILSLFTFLFFSYGHFCKLLIKFELVIKGFTVDAFVIVFILSGFVFVLGTYLFLKTQKNLRSFTKFLNALAISFVLMSLIQITVFKYNTLDNSSKMKEFESTTVDFSKISYTPNIYYIILDGYARSDVLKELFDFDNKTFLDYLTNKGFYIANKSVANYCQTILSLPSSMNSTYLNKHVLKIDRKNKDLRWLRKLLNYNHTFKFLKQYNYKTISFDTSGWHLVKLDNSDTFYCLPGLSLFKNKLLNSTPLLIITSIFYSLEKHLYDIHRHKIEFALNKIEDLSKDKGPYFVYAHLLIPHQPFIFGKNGEAITPKGKGFSVWCWDTEFRNTYKKNYLNQLKYTNKRVRKLVDVILANSDKPPIIILQSDHGSALKLDPYNIYKTNLIERMGILNAYYLPKGGKKKLYSSITPVNTFRVIFNHYFNGNYQLLKDRSYFSNWEDKLKFIDVSDKVLNNKSI